MHLNKYYENPEILHVNTEQNRCYYIPLNHQGEAEKLDLNGTWRFHYYPSPDKVEDFLQKDIELEGGVDIPVPSNWQYHGFDTPQYVNIRYPFPFDPPYVPLDNPCGLYQRAWEVSQADMDKNLFLNFEGVDSCFYVWINNSFAGYSQVSHGTSEFAVSGYVKHGVNNISVLVLKWCDGSYLEDQDKFRLSGIFRDVYILKRPNQYIRDYNLRTTVSENLDSAKIHVEVECIGAPQIQCSIFAPDKTLLASKILKGDQCDFDVLQPLLWNAETPFLYEIELQGEEIIRQKIGIRKIEICDSVVLLNNTPIKIKGVNRHDSSPFNGSAITREEALKDLQLMKQHNINAIRTSHYPCAPWFLEMCDLYGFYVLDEADLESHGCGMIYSTKDRDNISLIARDPMFREAVLDRVQRMVMRDRNRTSVIFWSLGNESGYGTNLEEAGRWVKSYDSTRLLHYESGTWNLKSPADISMLDVVSRMYADLAWVDDYCQNPESFKPFIQCEFCHAMGNGPGDLEDNYKQIYRYDNYAGGFIWEWCDHAVFDGVDENECKHFLYGGDNKETPHDSNFCMDGLVYPDRRPHTGLLEYKNVIRPVRAQAKDLQKGIITLHNTYDFLNLREILDVEYEVKKDGNIWSTGVIGDIDIAPHREADIQLALPNEDMVNIYIKLTYIQKEKAFLTDKGHIMGFDQIEIARRWKVPPIYNDNSSKSTLLLEDSADTYEIAGSDFSYTFSKRCGAFCSIKKEGINYLDAAMKYNVFRAPTDNDKMIKLQWMEAGYDRTVARVYDIVHEQNADAITIRCNMAIMAVSLQPFIRMEVIWTVDRAGKIFCDITAGFDTEFPFLPRFGLLLELPKSFQQVIYNGYGPSESYIDKHQACYIDEFHSSIKELHEDYIRPQENGSHCGCSEVKIGSNGHYLNITGETLFSFNASNYTIEELTAKNHNYELVESDRVNFCIDYMQSGLGSASCGPDLLDKYKVHEEKISWRFVIDVM